jgi:hypothetical protein
MSKLVKLALACAIGCGAMAAGAEEIQDSVVADPDVHQVMFENEHVRVFRALAEAGTKSPMHSHPPMVLVSLSTARVRTMKPDGTQRILDMNPGQAIWIDGTEHSWELLAGEISVVAVEVKAAAAAKAAKGAKAAAPAAKAEAKKE